MSLSHPMFAASTMLALLASAVARGAPPNASEVKAAFERFNRDWDDTAWEPESGGRLTRYMRPLSDQGWKRRMLALQAIAAAGEAAIPVVEDRLRNGSDPERILAAQSAGFLGGEALHEALVATAEKDATAATRLYAFDALGMLGLAHDSNELTRWEESETNRDARKHLNYVAKRGENKLDPSFVATLRGWDASQMDSAKLGALAPDFTLPDLKGDPIRLSDYRGKNAVVLVFVYGDT